MELSGVWALSSRKPAIAIHNFLEMMALVGIGVPKFTCFNTIRRDLNFDFVVIRVGLQFLS